MLGRRHALGLSAMGALASPREARAFQVDSWTASETATVVSRITGGGVASNLAGSCSRGGDHAGLVAADAQSLAPLLACPICGCAIQARR